MEIEEIEGCIVLIRGVRVIMDSDLARLFGVSTKRLNEQVRRNIDRFPQDFMFQLTQDEKTKVVANCDHLQQLRFSTALPLAFTEHGTIMAASILNSTKAIETSILVVRAFVRMRHMIAMVSDLAERLDEMESRYDQQFHTVFRAIRELIEGNHTPADRPRIGFRSSADKTCK